MWYDVQTDRVKIATHCRFDEGMNDLPIEALPPNVQYLLRSEGGDIDNLRTEPKETHARDLQFFIYPFSTTFEGTIPLPCSKDNCGMSIADDSVLQRSYVTDIAAGSSASKMLATLKQTLRKVKGAYITKIGDDPVFSSADVTVAIKKYQDQGGQFSIAFALEPMMTAKQLKQAHEDFSLMLPPPTKSDEHTSAADAATTLNNDDGSQRPPLGTKI